MKKIIGLMLVLALILSSMAVTILGAEAKFTLSGGMAKAGEEVTLTLSVSDNPGFTTALINVTYDTEKFTLTEVSDQGKIGNPNHSDDYSLSVYPLSWYNPLAEENYTYNGDLVTLTFEVSEGVETGEYPVTLEIAEVYNAKMENVTLSKADGKIEVYERAIFTGLTLEDKSFTYDGTAKSLEIKGTVPEGATVNFENNEAIDVSVNTVTATVTKEGYEDLTLEATLSVTPKDIEITGIIFEDKIYDGTASVACEGGRITGVVSGDSVGFILGETAAFENASAGKNKNITVDVTLTGEDKDNYNLVTPALKGEIEKKEITLRGVNLDDNSVTFTGVLDSDSDGVAINFAMIEIELSGEASPGRTMASVSKIMLTGEKSGNYVLNGNTFETSISNAKTTLVTAIVDRGGSVEGAGRHIKGTKVTLTAKAKSGYKFVRWEIGGESAGNSRSYTFTAGEDLEIEAVFKRNSTGVGSGTVKDEDDDKITTGGTTTPPATTTPPVTVEQPSELTAPAKRVPEKEIVLTIGKTEATVFGETKTNDVSAVIKNSRTMLPIRFIAEALKATVSWDGEKREVLIKNDSAEIIITIDSASAMINGNAVTLDSPAFIEKDRTFLPVRFISETLGADVYWDGATQSVIIQVK